MVKGLERTKSVLAAALVALVAATPVLAQDDIKMDGGETGPQPVSAYSFTDICAILARHVTCAIPSPPWHPHPLTRP